jgi:uncharacterized protein (TIGR00369 family)
MMSVERVNEIGHRYLSARLGIVATHVEAVPTPTMTVQMKVRRGHLAPHDFVHGGAIALLADTACGYGCLATLSDRVSGFLTIESKTNHLGAVQSGVLECTARARHVGRSTQVWDAEILELVSGKLVAMFRCTQLLLYANSDKALTSVENTA